MKKLVRLVSVLAFVLAMTIPAYSSVADCPDVYISTDGGQTWSQCDFNGGVEVPGWLICVYTCYLS
jgi:hypothetical protein